MLVRFELVSVKISDECFSMHSLLLIFIKQKLDYNIFFQALQHNLFKAEALYYVYLMITLVKRIIISIRISFFSKFLMSAFECIACFSFSSKKKSILDDHFS